MAVILKANGGVIPVTPKNGKTFRFEGELYDTLATDTIQVVKLADGKLMLLDENARLRVPNRNLALRNRRATDLLHLAGGMPDDFVIGDAVVIEADQLA